MAGSAGEDVEIKRTLGLGTATMLLINTCLGTGIFVSPVGVLEQVGSVGATLIIWALCGLFTIALALCYAELGTAIPVAGGDYAYITRCLGPFPGFLCLWITIMLLGPCAAGMMAQIGSTYFITIFNLEFNSLLILILASIITMMCAMLNMYSVVWAARVGTWFSAAKIMAMAIIIIAGLVKIAEGNTGNFTADNVWEGSNYSPGAILFSLVPGVVTYGGWECINGMAEEMKNPKRDIPIVAVAGVLTVTSIYVLVNVAYFSVLSPEEFLKSSVVAQSFSEYALPGFGWIVPVFVVISAVGTLFSLFLYFPRSTFAGGRNGQLPVIFSYIHMTYLTPVPAIMFMVLMCLMFIVIGTVFDIGAIVNMLGLFAQLKYSLTLVALIYMKIKMKNLKGTVSVPLPVVVFCLVMLLSITVIAVYMDPKVMGLGMVMLFAGVPLYHVQQYINENQNLVFSDKITLTLQKILLVLQVKANDSL